MKTIAFTLATGAALAAALAAAPAAAQTVYNTDLPDLNGANAGGSYSTTTDATGTRTNSQTTGSANRVTAPSPAAESWYQANVGSDGTVGITTDYARNGNGSAFFSTTNGSSKGDLQYNLGSLVALSSFSSISYDFFRDAASTTGGNFAPVFRLNMVEETNGSFAFAGSLVLEYLYQNQLQPPAGSWTTVSSTLTQGTWWATNSRLGPTFAAANGGQKSLDAWIAGNAGSTLYVSGYNIGVGSGWNGQFSGALDNIAITSARGSEAFNFEVQSLTGGVPEPSAWALLILGFGLTGAAMRRKRTAVAFA